MNAEIYIRVLKGAILGRIKPVTSILAEKILTCFSVVYFRGNLNVSCFFQRNLKLSLFLVTDRLLSRSALNPRLSFT